MDWGHIVGSMLFAVCWVLISQLSKLSKNHIENRRAKAKNNKWIISYLRRGANSYKEDAWKLLNEIAKEESKIDEKIQTELARPRYKEYLQ